MTDEAGLFNQAYIHLGGYAGHYLIRWGWRKSFTELKFIYIQKI